MSGSGWTGRIRGRPRGATPARAPHYMSAATVVTLGKRAAFDDVRWHCGKGSGCDRATASHARTKEGSKLGDERERRFGRRARRARLAGAGRHVAEPAHIALGE